MKDETVDAASRRLNTIEAVDAASRRVNNPETVDAASRRVSKADMAPAATSVHNELPAGDCDCLGPGAGFTYFDPKAPIANLAGNLPHWRQDYCIYFVTFRLADSLPQERLHQWLRDRDAWLARNPPPHSPRQRREYRDQFTERLQDWLDQGYGSCVLRDPRAKLTVENALRHFDGDRYQLDEFIVMPNHVHALLAPSPPYELSDIVHSWKSFTAKAINRLFGRRGTLWQKEPFDHIVLSPESLERIRQYIRDNPKQTSRSGVPPLTGRMRRDAASTP